MDSNTIAGIASGVSEALASGRSWCATFEIPGDPDKWVQFTDGTINAAYPYAEAPEFRLGAMESFSPDCWEAGQYVTGPLTLEDSVAIARWIDRYFVEVLG